MQVLAQRAARRWSFLCSRTSARANRGEGLACELRSHKLPPQRAFKATQANPDAAAAFVGITPGLTKEEQIAQKNSDIDQVGIWEQLPRDVQLSLKEPGKVGFVSWLGYGVTQGKAAIVQLFTAQECDAIIGCMKTDGETPGVMSASRTAELYQGRVNTSRHLIADERMAKCLLQRFQNCLVPAREGSAAPLSLLSQMKHGLEVVAVNEKIRLVSTEEGGEHQKHADISEPSDDGSRISRLTFQCYLNPEAYEGGRFQLYPEERGGNEAVDIEIEKGCAVVFVQEDPELLHGGGPKGPGAAKRAIRGNLDVAV